MLQISEMDKDAGPEQIQRQGSGMRVNGTEVSFEFDGRNSVLTIQHLTLSYTLRTLLSFKKLSSTSLLNPGLNRLERLPQARSQAH
jgi:hypothetical protein